MINEAIMKLEQQEHYIAIQEMETVKNQAGKKLYVITQVEISDDTFNGKEIICFEPTELEKLEEWLQLPLEERLRPFAIRSLWSLPKRTFFYLQLFPWGNESLEVFVNATLQKARFLNNRMAVRSLQIVLEARYDALQIHLS